jgi:peptide/nickel transport system substrate-binding protein
MLPVAALLFSSVFFGFFTPVRAATLPTLVVGTSQFIPALTDLNPMKMLITYYMSETFLPMVGWNSTGGLEPLLAQSWTISPNGTVYTFDLRPNLKWSDGQPLTSADIKFTIDDYVNQSSLWYYLFTPLETASNQTYTHEVVAPGAIDTPNSTTVVFHLSGPYAPFITYVGGQDIIPQHTYQGFNFTANNPPLSTMVGSGPFIPTSYTAGSELTMLANPYYFAGAPKLSQVVFNFYQDSTSAEIALESGQVNYMQSVPPTDASALAGKGLTVATEEDQSNVYLAFNVLPTTANNASNPASNLQVRQAIAMALNIGSILNASLGAGHYLEANQIEVPNMLYNGVSTQNKSIPNPEYPYNPTAAGQLLTQAGYPPASNGTRFQLSLVAPAGGIGASGTGPTTEMLQLIQSELAAVGINLHVSVQDTTDFDNNVYGATPPKPWNIALSIISESPDPDVTAFYMVGSLAGNAGAGGFNAGGYNNSQINQLITQEENTVGTAQRVAIFQQIDGIIHDQLPVLELSYQIEVVAWSPQYQGFQLGLGNPEHDYWGALKAQSLANVSLVSSTSTTSSATSASTTSNTSTTSSSASSVALNLSSAAVTLVVAAVLAAVVVTGRRTRRSGRLGVNTSLP